MTPTPELPQYLVDAAARFDATNAAEDFAVLEQAMRQAFTDIYFADVATTDTPLKEAA